MAEQAQPAGRFSSFINRAADRLPPVSALPHLARQQTAKLDPRQHAETLQLQLLVKSLSGVVQDRTSLSREQETYAKNLFLWSKDDKGDDLVDICDRLAFLEYQTSEVEKDAAKKLEESRTLLKDIRNFENDLVPRRRSQQNIATRIATLQKEASAATSRKSDRKLDEQISKLQAELSAVAAENTTFESSFAVLKRTKLHESFALQFQAQKELGEKLALIAGYGEVLLRGMETDGTGPDYSGKERTARVKAELEAALKHWSFGDTHASVLGDETIADDRSETSAAIAHASVARSHPHLAHPPPLATLQSEAEFDFAAAKRDVPPPPLPPHPSSTSTEHLSIPPPLPARHSPTSPTFGTGQGINLSPTPRPQVSALLASPPALRAHPVPPEYGTDSAPRDPTVAETGEPIVGTGGPVSGVLRPRRPSNAAAAASPPSAPVSVEQPAQQRMPGTFDEAGWSAESETAADHLPQNGPAMDDSERLPQYGEGDDEAARARARAEAILAEERARKSAT
ncbi:hypothetical protein BMF94_4793 [Rhodotorula taiwanensis]|uniref:Eisosome component PIL1-domain-containing protein n=1 Tax=Rhodotorula taiwanensis TaxID=741276 RepID=A0A2S5B5X4_9BASI|nr:hypothetical protein BMF94_4793 [Rhodotorula taiwanensis]